MAGSKGPVAVVGDSRRRTSPLNAHPAAAGEGDGEVVVYFARAEDEFGADHDRLNCLERDFGAVRRCEWLVFGEW